MITDLNVTDDRIALYNAIKRYVVSSDGHTVECLIYDKEHKIVQSIGAEINRDDAKARTEVDLTKLKGDTYAGM